MFAVINCCARECFKFSRWEAWPGSLHRKRVCLLKYELTFINVVFETALTVAFDETRDSSESIIPLKTKL